MNALKKLAAFCEQYSTPPDAELIELERAAHLHTLSPQMLCGHLQGQFLSLLSKLMRPKGILEIGTFTGYASICLAKGLQEKGILHTIEANQELAWLCRKYFQKAGLEDKIRLHIGDAKEIIPMLASTFDIVYIDAGKKDNALFFDLVFDKVASGGLILADNVLWSGKVPANATDSDTLAIEAFNRKVFEDARVESLMLPIRDGILMARKI